MYNSRTGAEREKTCPSCGGVVDKRRTYCSEACRPSANTIVLRLSPEAVEALARVYRSAIRRGLIDA